MFCNMCFALTLFFCYAELFANFNATSSGKGSRYTKDNRYDI